MTQFSKRDVELCWAAGFFDGEGSTSLARSIHVSIGQVNRDNLFRFMNAVRVGTVSRPYDKGKKPISFYRAYSDDAFAVIRALDPFLGEEKKAQFLRAAIKYCFRSVQHRSGNPT